MDTLSKFGRAKTEHVHVHRLRAWSNTAGVETNSIRERVLLRWCYSLSRESQVAFGTETHRQATVEFRPTKRLCARALRC